ncbi:hypothetical protein DFH06DRAFT_1315875 [Mycena polygramma]|nr:hypothetical protein DFH06DRAFT_1315875 [Mycena polygramma]
MALTDYFKLHRADALVRIRRNAFALLLILVLSTLVPRIPALPTAFAVALSEVGAVALMSLNILQAVYAVKYPLALPPPSPSPAKAKGLHMGTPTPKRAFRLSPNSSPQLQKSFSFGASGSVLQSSTSSSAYPSSPLSTPSRVLHYSIPPSSSPSTFSMSSSSNINTPSPILSTYLGKHGGDYAARPFDGAFLSEIRKDPDSDED